MSTVSHTYVIILYRFNAGGIDAINWCPYNCSSHGPRKFMAEVVEQICEVALSPSQKLIGMSVWSLEKLRQYLRRYRRTETLHIVLDNASYHLKTEVQQYAATHNIRFYWTPTNASWLNRIESHLTAIRKFALDNTDYPSHDEQEDTIESYLRWRNGDPLCSPMLDLNDTHPWGADRNDVDFIGLHSMVHGKREVRQQNPFVVALLRLKMLFQMFDGLALALIGHRPTLDHTHLHARASCNNIASGIETIDDV